MALGTTMDRSLPMRILKHCHLHPIQTNNNKIITIYLPFFPVYLNFFVLFQMGLNGRSACCQHCSNGITICVQNQWAFLRVEILNGFKWSIRRRVNIQKIPIQPNHFFVIFPKKLFINISERNLVTRSPTN